jgi:hypothetical protein
LQADQAGGVQGDRRGIPVALVGKFNPSFWRLEIDTWFIARSCRCLVNNEQETPRRH